MSIPGLKCKNLATLPFCARVLAVGKLQDGIAHMGSYWHLAQQGSFEKYSFCEVFTPRHQDGQGGAVEKKMSTINVRMVKIWYFL